MIRFNKINKGNETKATKNISKHLSRNSACQRCANSGFSAPAPATLQLRYLAPAWLANNWEENPTGYYSAQLCSQGFLPVKAAKLSSDKNKCNATTSNARNDENFIKLKQLCYYKINNKIQIINGQRTNHPNSTSDCLRLYAVFSEGRVKCERLLQVKLSAAGR